MKLDDLLKTKAAQDPRNAAALALCSVEGAKRKHSPAPALEPDTQAKSVGKVRVVVRIVHFSKRTRDDDNIAGGYKPLRDAIADSLGIDDGDERIEFRIHGCRY